MVNLCNMATASIKIVGYQDPELTFNVEGTNFITIPSMDADYLPKAEYEGQDFVGVRKLTWRDFTIDMSPFDYNYQRMTGLMILEYGTYNPNNIEELTPNNSLVCMVDSTNIVTTPYPVGTLLSLVHDNVTDSVKPTRVRDAFLPITPIYLKKVVGVTYSYVKVRIYYDGVPSTKTKVLYNVTGKTNPNVLGEYLNDATIRVIPNTIAPIDFNNLLEGLDYKQVRSSSLTPTYTWNQVMDNLVSPTREFYERIFPDLMISDPRGNPLKITIWDDNVNKRILINGNPLVNGMSIPFEMFKSGQVFFNSIGMTETDNYEVHFSIMDLISGVMVINFQE